MATEIERKFLVRDLSWKSDVQGVYIAQGYLCTEPGRTVRIRIAGEKAWITIKGKNDGIARSEFEYAVPLEDARQLLALCGELTVEKIRYRVPAGNNLTWEIDEFLKLNKDLYVAEIELVSVQQPFVTPSWLGDEVSEDRRYYNSCLARFPYSLW